jgi:H/ACA ribonucleoprotein complex subunit 3
MIYFRIENGERKYTLQEQCSESVNPAKYSVDDKFSAERIEMKKRFGIFPFNE